ncbi:MAG: T9SS type A sorting domain-containing protein [Ignavibacteria bacterium]|nr:T9SS type A sorting domain-containing protein [Ignavibacteria bacterium]
MPARILISAVLMFIIFCPSSWSQTLLENKERLGELETPDQAYHPVRSGQSRTPAYSSGSGGWFFTQVNVDSNGMNIVGDAANEPSIAVDVNDPTRIAIGWRQFDTITNNFRQAGNGWTSDGGVTWNYNDVIQRGLFRSDPVLDSDINGIFYYNSLSGDFTCQVFKSTDGGDTWIDEVDALGGDKQWMDIDKSDGPGEGHIYAYWTQNFSVCSPGFFTRSANRGASFEACTEIDGEPFWGTLATGPESELYTAGVGFTDFVVTKSTTVSDSSVVAAWDTSVVVSLDGSIEAFGSGSPNPSGLLGQTWIAVDHSEGDTRGNVYLLCSVSRFSNSDPLDVMFARSTDGGLTWSDPVRVNDDSTTTAWQWFGTMSVAPDGRIDVMWLDTRDNPGTVLSSLYYSYSTDAGDTWAANQRLSDDFDPHVGWPNQNKMGDYFDMVSTTQGAHLAWAGTFNGEQDVYYGFMPAPVTGVDTPQAGIPSAFELEQNYPNPFNPTTEIGFSVPQGGFVHLTIFDQLGQEVATLVNGELAAGRHVRTWNAAGMTSGVYYYRLEAGGLLETRKLMLLR